MKKRYPQALELGFIGGKPLRGSEVELISVCEEKVFLCGVKQCESAVFIVDHKVFFRKAVRKMFAQDRENMMVWMDLGEQDAVFQFLKAHKTKQMASRPVARHNSNTRNTHGSPRESSVFVPSPEESASAIVS